jgi:hypothetical protein
MMFRAFSGGDTFIVVIVGVVAFALGVWGYWDCSFTFVPDPADATKLKPYYSDEANCHVQSGWHVFLATFSLLKFSGFDFTILRKPPWPPDPWQLIIAQYALPGITIFAGIGATLKVFYEKVRRDMHIVMAGRQKDHIIICGLGKTAMQVVQNLHDLKKKHAVVIIDPKGEEINAATCEKLGIPVITGDPKNEGIMKIAGFASARTMVVATGDDASNIEIAMRLRDFHDTLPINGRNRITIFTEIDNDWLFAKMHAQENHALGLFDVEMRLFNAYENSARALIQDMPPPIAPELAAGALVLVGFGKMGRTVALQFLRAAPTALGQRMRIIVFDRAIKEAQDAFKASAPAAQEFGDIEFIRAKLAADQPEDWAVVAKTIANEPLLAVVSCLSEDLDNLYAGMELRRLLDSHDQHHVPIYVRLAHHNRLGRYAASTEAMVPIADRLKGFGMLENLLNREILLGHQTDKLARAWHEEYRKSLPPERQDTPANRPWSQLPESYKMSNRRACDHLPIKLAQAGLRMEPAPSRTDFILDKVAASDPVVAELSEEEIDLLARLEHRRWLIERRLLGWRYGPKRSDLKRINPMLVEWDKLPEVDRQRNKAEIADLPRMLAAAGYVLRRVHLIRAYGDWIPDAAALMDQAETHKEQRHNLVLAEIDRPEGFGLAERAAALSNVSLWLVSREDPLSLARRFKDEQEKRFKKLLEKADGWTRCDHLIPNAATSPKQSDGKVEDIAAAKAARTG